ncbi:hypothetical protein BHE74_00022873, partial [Ensete ventricosum]
MGWQIGGRSNYAIGGPRGALSWYPFPTKRRGYNSKRRKERETHTDDVIGRGRHV